jgi:hypothetical protein
MRLSAPLGAYHRAARRYDRRASVYYRRISAYDQRRRRRLPLAKIRSPSY